MTDTVLVTGASGYIGGRLVPQLLDRGYSVRCLAREPRKLSGQDWSQRVQIAQGDAFDPPSLHQALAGCRAAYYLIHSMAAGERGFEDRDRLAAANFAQACAEAHLERVVYLGGLGRRDRQLSSHLNSRHEVGDILRAGSTPVTELRAAMIVGSGSASFEMMRSLVERLPIMVCPRWVETRSQPIAISDVLRYLVECLEKPESSGQILDIGGPEILTYREMMLRFAAILGLKRRMLVVPVLTPRLSAYWANLVTPVPAGIAFPLIEGLKSEMVCEDHRIRRLIPFEPLSFDESVRGALQRVQKNQVETRWTNASLPSPPASKEPRAFREEQFSIQDRQRIESKAPPAQLFAAVRRIGGEVGWYHANSLWRVRGAMDRLIGGVGLRRGRRDPERVRIGDAIDFWRVMDYREGERLLLRAEMTVPGDAWLEFRVNPLDHNRSELLQTAFFNPTPFWGRLYWYALYPLHWLIFRGMARNLARAAEQEKAVPGQEA